MRDRRIEQLLGATAAYCGGPRIGPVTGVFVDEEYGRPRWAVVGPGRAVPLCRTLPVRDGRLLVALPPGAVEAAPPLPPGAVELRTPLDDALYAHYAAVLAPVSHPGAPLEGAPPAADRVVARRAR